MKTQIFILLAVVSILVCNARADLTWDSGHREYSAGDETWVYMYNDASVDITGGNIDELRMYDDTSAEVTGGTIGLWVCNNSSSADLDEIGSVDFLKPSDNSLINILDGSVNLLAARDFSETNISGGSLNIIDALDSSTINLYVDIDNYFYDPTGGQFNDGLLTGLWLNSDQSFNIELLGSGTINHINIIPEPLTIVLIVGGIPFLKRKHKTL